MKYPRAIFDEQADGWVSDAAVAEISYTAFTSEKGKAVTAQLIVGRICWLEEQTAAGQGELFATALPPDLHRQPVCAGSGRGTAS